MKIAIHHRKGSFSDEWIKFCDSNNIDYKIVNAYSNTIINDVKGYDLFIWHHHHVKIKDVISSKKILFSLEQSGMTVYPNFNTGWHFDDKVAQKYLLEAINAPLVPSFVFYDKNSALKWLEDTTFPKVWKLKGGAGGSNVKLIHKKAEATNYINKAFNSGFKQFNKWGYLKEKITRYKNGKDNLSSALKAIGRIFIPTELERFSQKEKGYIYFQEFIPNNSYDIRIVVIGNQYAAGEKRFVRKDDFRASGSGEFNFENIDTRVIKLAFEVSKKLKLQSVAFDFIFDDKNNPLIIEMSYGFGTKGISQAPGYWDNNLNWISTKFEPQKLLLKTLMM